MLLPNRARTLNSQLITDSQLSTIDCQMWQCQTYDKSIPNSLYIEKFLYFCKKF